MPAVTLHRIDPERKLSRFYRLDLQPDLFGAWGVIREWGRIGRPGRLRVDAYPAEADAAAQMHRMQAHKRGRGYVPAMTGQNARNSLLVVQQWPTIV